MKMSKEQKFWVEIREKYPKAFIYFEKWLSDYQMIHDWGSLFNAREVVCGNDLEILYAPSYYILPLAMQFGIFFQFAFDVLDYGKGYGRKEIVLKPVLADSVKKCFMSGVDNCFKNLEEAL